MRVPHIQERQGHAVTPRVIAQMEHVVTGEGRVVLVLHGVFGGWQQGLHAVDYLLDHALNILSVSRPGYGATPLLAAATPAEQADLVVDLLDQLQLGRVAVCATSAGGPVGIELALRHPERVSSLVLLSAFSRKPDVRIGPGQLSIVRFALVVAGIAYRRSWVRPRLLRSIIRSMSTYNRKENRREVARIGGDRALVEDVWGYFPAPQDWAVAVDGAVNDIRQCAQLRDLGLADIRCPTLVVHGTRDGSPVKFVDAEWASGQIPDADLLPVRDAWHMISVSPYAAEVETTVADFVNRHFDHDEGN